MDEIKPEPEEIRQNKDWFEFYIDRMKNHSRSEPPKEGLSYDCPCCGYNTLSERSDYDIYQICFWEDDGQADQDADIVRGGPNGALSLSQAKIKFQKFGACEERFIKHTRKPLPQ